LWLTRDEVGLHGKPRVRQIQCVFVFHCKIKVKTVAAGKIGVNERGGNSAAGRDKKNRVRQPEDGRKTRGIQNEHHVGLRRTRATGSTQAGAEIVKFKDQVVGGLFPIPSTRVLNHSPLFLSMPIRRYK
jgi:hypothetical protein